MQTAPGLGSNNDRRILEKPLENLSEDNGGIFICPQCKGNASRYGGPVFGARDILIKRCTEHERSKHAKDLDTFIKGRDRVDPRPPAYKRTGARKTLG
jgi:hypothetical protein